MDVTPAELKDYLCYQTGALREYCRAAGAELQHMKPHGILYTMIEKQSDQAWSTAIGEASKESGKELILMALASGNYDADRAQDGRAGGLRGLRRPRLQRRSQPGLAQAARLAHHRPARRRPTRPCGWRMESKVKTIDGVDVDISVQTICCHGDTPGAAEDRAHGARGARQGGLPGQAAARLAAPGLDDEHSRSRSATASPGRGAWGVWGAISGPPSQIRPGRGRSRSGRDARAP